MYWTIEVLAPGATTYNFTVEAESRLEAIEVARDLGAEPIDVRLTDRRYRHYLATPPGARR